MKQLNTYLIFKGDCKDALAFYKECLNGEIVAMKTFEDVPFNISEENKDFVFDSEFRAGDITLRASDSLPENEITIGSNFALFVDFSERKEHQEVFAKLSKGGHIIMPLAHSPSGSKFGMLSDKFGIQWMLACHN